eukprot:955773-Rhodomonas_salina.1
MLRLVESGERDQHYSNRRTARGPAGPPLAGGRRTGVRWRAGHRYLASSQSCPAGLGSGTNLIVLTLHSNRLGVKGHLLWSYQKKTSRAPRTPGWVSRGTYYDPISTLPDAQLQHIPPPQSLLPPSPNLCSTV